MGSKDNFFLFASHSISNQPKHALGLIWGRFGISEKILIDPPIRNIDPEITYLKVW